jgi:hypothetical protein
MSKMEIQSTPVASIATCVIRPAVSPRRRSAAPLKTGSGVQPLGDRRVPMVEPPRPARRTFFCKVTGGQTFDHGLQRLGAVGQIQRKGVGPTLLPARRAAVSRRV